jgi:hypothetical protein
MAIVYKHIRKDKNEIFYIGIGKTIARAKSKKSRNNHWYNIINKTDYSIEIIHNNISWEDACELEKTYIKQYGRKDLGLGLLVNMTDGGDGISNISDETKKKMSNKKIDKKLTQEHILKITQNNKMRGKSNKWGNHTEENIEIIRNHSIGKNHTQESIIKQRTLKESKKIIIYNDTTEITFNSISSCIKDFFNVVQYNNKKEFDKIRSGIRDVLSTKRKQKTYKGYKFIYV